MSGDCAVTTAALRPLLESDLPQVLAWRNDPAVRSRMFSRELIEFPDHVAWFHRVSADRERSAFLVMQADRAVGFVQFSRDPQSGGCEWGFYKDPEAPPGTGRSIGHAALDHAFLDMQWEYVRGRTLSDNIASQRLHERLGFSQLSTIPEGLEFAISRAEWLHARKAVK